ncbi:hypothetical protein BDN71DRAFT_1457500 [Pleurotus eryngii]|uniref:Uncharacterized protein n=1 Tax=Pleurotus eryngii TaxID=5323 RepID=A0A9P5ZKM0_PLEER|nr:hypothetical protein BDN71DRAFT_1457500 [Pleurotus eryngii]
MKVNVRLAILLVYLAYSAGSYGQSKFSGYGSNGIEASALVVQLGHLDRRRLYCFYVG